MREARTGRTPAVKLGLLGLVLLAVVSCRRVERAAPEADDASPAVKAPEIVTTRVASSGSSGPTRSSGCTTETHAGPPA